MKIALDLDGTLADLHGAMIRHSEYEDHHFDSWYKPDFNTFLSEASTVWDDYWWDINPVEPNLCEKTALLTADHTVDIVTNTVGSDEATISWLDKYGISYRDIVRPSQEGMSKSEMEYEVYIDDKPSMGGEVNMLYIPDRRWNQEVRGQGEYIYHSYEMSYIESEGLPANHFETPAPHVVRITDIHDVLYDLHRYENV